MKSFLLAIDWHVVRIGMVILSMGIFTVIVETMVMVLFKFHRFRKSLVDSIMANIGSVLLSILLFLIFNKSEFDIPQVAELFILYCIVSVFEAFLIRLLNTTMPWGRILVTSFVMNCLSFVLLYFVFTMVLARFFSP